MFKTFKLSGTACLCAAMFITTLGILCFGAVGRAYAAKSEEQVALPIIMYHSVVNDPKFAGDYVVTTDELESDIQYILSAGYTPIFCSEAADFVENGTALPESPIILSFDDGSYNNFYYVLPLLEKYKVKAVFAPVGKFVEESAGEESPSPIYSYMKGENLKSCVNSGLVELANHTYSMHELEPRKGALRMDGENAQDYRRELWSDLSAEQKLLKECGQEPVTLAYPYGFLSDESEKYARELGFRVTLSCEERVNKLAVGDYSCTYKMGRFNRSSGRSVQNILESLSAS